MDVVDFARIPQIARNMERFGEILAVLAKYGLADWVDKLNSRFLHQLLRRTSLERLSAESHDARVRLAFTELGTTFIKLGQMLSSRGDVVGVALANELTGLQSNVPADPFSETRRTVEAELKRPLGDLFAEFAEVPLASASIGQAHLARTHDGRAVVVKVQHPNILAAVQADLAILAALAELVEQYISELRLYRPVALIAELKKVLLRELDFRRELRHLQIFRRNFGDTPGIRFPEPLPEYSSGRVLTMEYLDGLPLRTRPATADGPGPEADLRELARRGARAYLDMIFRDGFFHADPHPGNILILPGNVLGVLDAGMVGRVDETLRRMIERSIVAVTARDSAAVTDLVTQIGQVPPEFDVAGLEGEIADQLAFYWGMPLEQFRLAAAFEEFTELVRTYRVVLPPTISLLLKVLVMLEGTGRLLDPHFNLTASLEEYKTQILKRRFSPRRVRRKLMASLREWDEVLQNLPRVARDLMRLGRDKRFAVQLQHQHLEPSVNRLVFGMMVSALFLGSSWLWAAKTPPELFGTSVLGALGCGASGVLGFRLFRAIQKSGKLEDQ